MEFPLPLPPTYLQLFLIVALPLTGVIYALLGTIKLSMAEKLNLDEGKVGRLVSGYGMMVGPTILLCGILSDAFPRQIVFLSGSAVVVAAVFILATARDFKGVLVGTFLLGAGWSAAINVANVLQYMAVTDPDKSRKAIQFFDCIFGFGAFITPMIFGFLLGRLGFSKALMVVAAVMLVPLGMGFFAEMNPLGPPSGEPMSKGIKDLLTSGPFLLVSFAFMFFVPLEGAVAGWGTTLVARQFPDGTPPEASRGLTSGALTGFWFCFMGSRLLVSFLEVKNPQIFLVALACAALALMLAFAFLRGKMLIAALVVTAGLICGPIFPTLISIMFSHAPPASIGKAVGFFFFFASIGWTVVPMLMGNVAKRTNIQKGFLVATASSVVFLILSIVLLLNK